MNIDDTSLLFLTNPPVDTLCAVEVNAKEYLLCFASKFHLTFSRCLLIGVEYIKSHCFSACAVYTDWQGWRSRQQELMWPAAPNAISKEPNTLLRLALLLPYVGRI